MKEYNLSGKDSLELITTMIQQTKQTLQLGSGNILLYYGYSSFVISIAVFFLCYFTGQMYWHFLWFLMFVPLFIDMGTKARRKPSVVTYIDKAVRNIWKVVHVLFVITVLAITLFGYLAGYIPFELMMPLSLLYVSIGMSASGVIMNERSMMFMPVVAFVFCIYMMVKLSVGHADLIWNLYCGLSFFFMLVVPGHILNHKSLRRCSKN